MRKTTKMLALLLALCMVLSLAACGGQTNEPANPDAPKQGSNTKTDTPKETPKNENHFYAVDKDTVVVCTQDETPSVTCRGHAAVAGGYLNNLTYEGLLELDENLVPQPCLAESYDYEDQADGTTLWTFHLRKGVKYHNGMEMTAKDVVASFAEAKVSPDVASVVREYDNVKAVDDYTVTLTTNGPSAQLLYDLTAHGGNGICPAELIEGGHDFNVEPIGTGPYILTSWTISESLTLTRFDDYWKGPAPIKNIVWKIIPEGSARTIALQAHEVDYIIELDSNDMGLVQDDPNLTLQNIDSLQHNWLNLNNEVKPFDNKLVRKAMNAAINKEDCVTVALNGAGIVAGGQTPIGLVGFDGEGYETFDVDLAKKYAAESGVDLSTVSFEVICSDDTKRRAGQVIQDNLTTAFGMTAELVSMDLATYLSETAAGHHDSFIGNYNSSSMVGFVRGLFYSGEIGSANKTRINIPELDDMIMTAAKTIDNDEREEVLKEISRYLNDLCPQIPLYQGSTLSAHNKYLSNVKITPSKRFWVENRSWE